MHVHTREYDSIIIKELCEIIIFRNAIEVLDICHLVRNIMIIHISIWYMILFSIVVQCCLTRYMRIHTYYIGIISFEIVRGRCRR